MQTRTTAARSVSATDVNYRTPPYIWLGLPENLLREWRNITLTGHHKTQGVVERAFLAPLEVDVRRRSGQVAHLEQKGRQHVGDDRPPRPQNLELAHLHAPHLNHVTELAGVHDLNFQKQHRVAGRQMGVLAHLQLLKPVFLNVTHIGQSHRRAWSSGMGDREGICEV